MLRSCIFKCVVVDCVGYFLRAKSNFLWFWVAIQKKYFYSIKFLVVFGGDT